jgi:putative SOS response-associated peptidase YedK
MCGRFSHPADWEDFLQYFPDLRVDAEFTDHYNIAPTMQIPVILHDGEGARLRMTRWGLVPHWCDDIKFGNKTFNARGETVAEKPSFRDSFRSRRCLIPANGYYEWKKEPAGGKTPYYLRLRTGRIFAFAGLWAVNTRCGQEELVTSTIITCEPNPLCAEVHHRMPVILCPEDYARWLDPANKDTASLKSLLVPYPEEEMEALRGTSPQDLFGG